MFAFFALPKVLLQRRLNSLRTFTIYIGTVSTPCCPIIHPPRNFRLLDRLRDPTRCRFRPLRIGYDVKMNDIITPLNLLGITLASWINRRQAEQIEFLSKQLEVYQRIAGKGRLPYTDVERRQLAVLAKKLGLKALMELPIWSRASLGSDILPLLPRGLVPASLRGENRPPIHKDRPVIISATTTRGSLSRSGVSASSPNSSTEIA